MRFARKTMTLNGLSLVPGSPIPPEALEGMDPRRLNLLQSMNKISEDVPEGALPAGMAAAPAEAPATKTARAPRARKASTRKKATKAAKRKKAKA
jgi:hypothetical protein